MCIAMQCLLQQCLLQCEENAENAVQGKRCGKNGLGSVDRRANIRYIAHPLAIAIMLSIWQRACAAASRRLHAAMLETSQLARQDARMSTAVLRWESSDEDVACNEATPAQQPEPTASQQPRPTATTQPALRLSDLSFMYIDSVSAHTTKADVQAAVWPFKPVSIKYACCCTCAQPSHVPAHSFNYNSRCYVEGVYVAFDTESARDNAVVRCTRVVRHVPSWCADHTILPSCVDVVVGEQTSWRSSNHCTSRH